LFFCDLYWGNDFNRRGTASFNSIFDQFFSQQSNNKQNHQTSQPLDVNSKIRIPFKRSILGGKIKVTSPVSGKKLQVNIPMGVSNETKIRLNGQGQSGLNGYPTGDLILTIMIEDDDCFKRKGNDLYCELPISIVQATLGSKLRVKTVYNKNVDLTISAATESGKRFLLKGLGVKTKNETGDLYVTIKIVPPIKITKKQKELLKEFDSLL